MTQRFNARFIGALIAKQRAYSKDQQEWHFLNTAITQCREHNEGVTFPEIHHLNMRQTQRQLARKGVTVG